MTTPEYSDRQEKRDKYLVNFQLITATSNMLQGYVDWILEEVDSLHKLAERLEYGGDSYSQRMLMWETRRLDNIRDNDLPEAKENVKQQMLEINEGSYSDIVDARRYLEGGLYRLETLVRDLLQCRVRLEGFEQEWDEPINPPGGNGQHPSDLS